MYQLLIKTQTKMDKVTTNTIQLTEKQEEKNWFTVRDLFEKKQNEECTHCSFLGTRLNLKTRNQECVFELGTEENDFVVLVELNSNKQILKRTLKIIKES